MSTAPPTLLLDVDGTLVDSTYLHVVTWCQVLADAGQPRPGALVQRQIGKGTPQLLSTLIGSELASSLGDELTARRSELYLGMRDQLRPLPGARELVETCVRRGLTVVLATSASPKERDVLLEVLDLPVDVAAITDADDVENAKPEPDILQVAMQRVGADPGSTLMLGDAVWDVEAGLRAGVPVLGVRTGGLDEAELLRAGAVAVYEDPAELVARLDDSPVGELLRRG